MNYGALLGRTWNIIWEHKFLILLGVLVALGSGGGGASTGSNVSFNQPSGEQGQMPQLPQLPGLSQMPDLGEMGPVAVVAVIVAAIAALFVGLALWVVASIARGGLIAGASAADEGRSASFGQAWGAAWRKGWRLLGIGLVPAIPGFLLAALGLGAAVFFGGLSRYLGQRSGVPVMGSAGILIASLSCILVPLMLVLGLLRTFANRACMLEDLGVFGSYGRGLKVLLENVGPALVLFLIQIGIGIAIAVVGFLPGLLAVLCCILWPLLLLVQGGISAYFSTMWTLAWRSWTGNEEAQEAALDVAV